MPTNSSVHKILDLVGDLALLGKQILGESSGRPCRMMPCNTALVSRLLRDKTLWEEVMVSDEEAARPHEISVEAAAGA